MHWNEIMLIRAIQYDMLFYVCPTADRWPA